MIYPNSGPSLEVIVLHQLSDIDEEQVVQWGEQSVREVRMLKWA
jgi:hypothetical protein